MKEDVFRLILQAEKEYRKSIETSADKAGIYVDGQKKNQEDFLKDLSEKWHIFEKAENDKLNERIAEDKSKAKTRIEEIKKQLKGRQEKKLEQISERLKKEVLTLDGDN